MRQNVAKPCVLSPELKILKLRLGKTYLCIGCQYEGGDAFMRKALIVTKGCPACAELKEMLRQKGKLQEYQIIDADTERGFELAQQLGVTHVPECVLIEGRGNNQIYRICNRKQLNKLMRTGTF